MLKEYAIADIIESRQLYEPFYIGVFEEMEDPVLEWPHRHSFYSIIWFTEGSGTYVVDFDEFEIVPNRLFFMNPRQVHNWEYSDNAQGLIVMWDETMGEGLDLSSNASCLDIPQSQSQFLKQLWNFLMKESTAGDSKSANNIRTGIQFLVTYLMRNADRNDLSVSFENPLLHKLKSAVFAERGKSASIEQIAENFGLPINDLNEICRESTGYTAKQYVLNLKITESKRLLLFSTMNVSEITYLLGFEDSSYFARIFKKKTSLSPSDFQKKYRK